VVYGEFASATPSITFRVTYDVFSNRKAAIDYIKRLEKNNGGRVFKNEDKRLTYTLGLDTMPLIKEIK